MVTARGSYRLPDLILGAQLRAASVALIRWGMPLLVGFGAYMVFNATITLLEGHAESVFTLVCGVLGVLWPILMPRIGAWRAARNEVLVAPRVFEISDDGITRRSDEGERAMKWSAFRRWFEVRDTVVVDLRADESVALPYRFFEHPAALDELRAMLHTNLGPPKPSPLGSVWRKRGYGCFLILLIAFTALVAVVRMTGERSPELAHPTEQSPP